MLMPPSPSTAWAPTCHLLKTKKSPIISFIWYIFSHQNVLFSTWWSLVRQETQRQFPFHIGILAVKVYIKIEESNIVDSADFRESTIDNLADFRVAWWTVYQLASHATGCIMYISMSNCILLKKEKDFQDSRQLCCEGSSIYINSNIHLNDLVQ